MVLLNLFHFVLLPKANWCPIAFASQLVKWHIVYGSPGFVDSTCCALTHAIRHYMLPLQPSFSSRRRFCSLIRTLSVASSCCFGWLSGSTFLSVWSIQKRQKRPSNLLSSQSTNATSCLYVPCHKKKENPINFLPSARHPSVVVVAWRERMNQPTRGAVC